ncbi:PQQ-dependent sugar dehydrogenase [Dactylosporangium cerinum]|uniref:PQQ-dependent sugar dehydrogenase n=1 Tax=Dactylosporangium cerinum TaxID=1434730 RepID=A0ABV9WHV4_9ACTN
MLSALVALSVAVPLAAAALSRATAAGASTSLPSGFSEQVVFSGLDHPTKLVFAPDGRVFVAEKKGVVKVFDSVSDPSPDVFADLSTNVYNYEDLGLLGLAVPPDFPANPNVYVSYSYDAPVGGVAPVYNDRCLTPSQGCVASGRVSRLSGGVEHVLLNDWCVQFESHHMGDVQIGPDGALYVTGGEGATASYTDWGQAGSPVNPCGDPPGGIGGAMSPPSAEGGALRAQDLRTPNDPTGLSGTLIRVDPLTGAARPGNPLYSTGSDANARRIVAMGLRNPFRWTFRPGTTEAWIADSGWRNWEEINRLPNPVAPAPTNFGWPCYEGSRQQPGFNNADLSLCESLYSAGTATPPQLEYAHTDKVAGSADPCPSGGSAPTGLAFYPASGGSFPAQYAGAMFFADYARQCIYASLPGAGMVAFAPGVATPVDLAVGPGGDLYYVDLLGGTVRRIRYSSGNQPPVAAAAATPASGPPPLAVSFSAAGTTDPDAGDILTYQWDFTGDGTFDATGATASYTYSAAGTYTARLRVTDAGGLSDTATVQVRAGTTAPTPVIDTPVAGTRWATGQTLTFTGHATDPQDGNLPASSLRWDLLLQHCSAADNCHTHALQSWAGAASGSFIGADHEYPSYLELRLTATDSGGLSGATTLRLDPKTVNLAFATNPSGLQLTVGPSSGATPFTRTVIQGSTVTMSAPATQSTYTFGSWSQGGNATQVITAPATATTYTASYTTTTPTTPTGGYTVATQARPFVSAGTILPLTGDDVVTRIALPTPVKLYGQTYTSAWVDTNGVVSFTDPGGSKAVNTALSQAPIAAVYPFWDDLVVDAQASVRMAVVDGRVVIEWRNVHIYGNTSGRLTFEVVLSGDGGVVTNYAELDNDAERGAGATVGIGGMQQSYTAPAMRSGQAVVYTPSSSSPPPPPPPPASGGYAVSTVAAPFVTAGNVVPLSGDDNIQQVTLPAPVQLYGQTYTSAWIDTNGKLSFVNPGTAYVEHSALPTTAQPNAAVYPCWQDLVVDAQASVRMGQAAGGVVVEWRNVRMYGNNSRRLSFSVVFASDGRITLHYDSLDNDVERGSNATVGVENASGTAATQFSYNQPRLATGTAFVFTPTSSAPSG